MNRPSAQGLVGKVVADVPETGVVDQPVHRCSQVLQDPTGSRGVILGDPRVDLTQVGRRRTREDE